MQCKRPAFDRRFLACIGANRFEGAPAAARSCVPMQMLARLVLPLPTGTWGRSYSQCSGWGRMGMAHAAWGEMLTLLPSIQIPVLETDNAASSADSKAFCGFWTSPSPCSPSWVHGSWGDESMLYVSRLKHAPCCRPMNRQGVPSL